MSSLRAVLVGYKNVAVVIYAVIVQIAGRFRPVESTMAEYRVGGMARQDIIVPAYRIIYLRLCRLRLWVYHVYCSRRIRGNGVVYHNRLVGNAHTSVHVVVNHVVENLCRSFYPHATSCIKRRATRSGYIVEQLTILYLVRCSRHAWCNVDSSSAFSIVVYEEAV